MPRAVSTESNLPAKHPRRAWRERHPDAGCIEAHEGIVEEHPAEVSERDAHECGGWEVLTGLDGHQLSFVLLVGRDLPISTHGSRARAVDSAATPMHRPRMTVPNGCNGHCGVLCTWHGADFSWFLNPTSAPRRLVVRDATVHPITSVEGKSLGVIQGCS